MALSSWHKNGILCPEAVSAAYSTASSPAEYQGPRLPKTLNHELNHDHHSAPRAMRHNPAYLYA